MEDFEILLFVLSFVIILKFGEFWYINKLFLNDFNILFRLGLKVLILVIVIGFFFEVIV